MEGMAEYPDKYFDLAIVDPPYGIGNFTIESDCGQYKKDTKKIKTVYRQNYEWNNSIPNKRYFKELKRVSIKQIIWGANYYNCFSKLGGAYVWYKNTGLVSQLSQCEIAALSWKKQVDYFSLKKLTGFVRKGNEHIHPCQKPIELYKDILKRYAKSEDKILDTHVGSASSLIACIDMGFSYVGYELDEDYYKAACKRIKIHTSQLKMV